MRKLLIIMLGILAAPLMIVVILMGLFLQAITVGNIRFLDLVGQFVNAFMDLKDKISNIGKKSKETPIIHSVGNVSTDVQPDYRGDAVRNQRLKEKNNTQSNA